MPFNFEELAIPDVLLVNTEVFSDERGLFMELYKQPDFNEAGISHGFVQDNLSWSSHGVLRGLHYQLEPANQAKLVRVTQGRIFDVAVDLRQGSPHFAKWVGRLLTAESRQAIYIPPGFAHGFQVISENAEVFYKVSQSYSPTLERGIRWNDERLAIDWPIKAPEVSAKDLSLPGFDQAECNFAF